MPRGKKKRVKRGGGGSGGGEVSSGQQSEDGCDTPDNASVISSMSDAPSIMGDRDGIAGAGDGEVDESSAQEDFEDKLKEAIDGTTQKSAKGRTECLLGLRKAFAKKYIPDFLMDRKMTVTDSLEKCLKKGKGEEQAAAATCAALLILQIGNGVDGEEIFRELTPVMTTIMADTSASSKGRAACARSVGMCTFIAGDEWEHVTGVMKALEKIFCQSYLKGDGASPKHGPEVCGLHTSALAAWSLLVSIAPPHIADELVDSHLGKLPQLLESSDVDLRITAGEVIALLYEIARENDEDFEGPDIDHLCELLKELATDSNKYRAKKDRRQQRSSFRDILRAVEENDVPYERIRFGTEYVDIDSWARKRQYDSLCSMLSSGMNAHLMENDLVREIFGLGAPLLPSAVPTHKTTKFEKKMYNAAAFRERTKARSKFRDKRAVAVHMASS